MRTQSETDAALARFRALLQHDPNVRDVRAVPTRGSVDVWVLLGRWDREHCFRVYEAHRQADPEALLDVHTTDDPAEIPDEAQPVGM